jgi:hypothetical protein
MRKEGTNSPKFRNGAKHSMRFYRTSSASSYRLSFFADTMTMKTLLTNEANQSEAAAAADRQTKIGRRSFTVQPAPPPLI